MNALIHPLSEWKDVAQWARQAQAGDREAFGRLFERYRQGILVLIRRRVADEHAAQELAQDVFVQAMQKIGQLRTPECFGSWLRRIAVRMAINYQQRARIAPAVDPLYAASAVIDDADPSLRAVRDEQAVRVRGGLQRLRPMDRQTLVAFYVRGRSLSEMAGDFSAPIGTIKRRLHMARKRLAAAIE